MKCRDKLEVVYFLGLKLIKRPFLHAFSSFLEGRDIASNRCLAGDTSTVHYVCTVMHLTRSRVCGRSHSMKTKS